MTHFRLPDFRAQPAAFLQALFAVAVQQAQPDKVLPAYLAPEQIRPAPGGRLLVLGAGKAAAAMAWAVEAACQTWADPIAHAAAQPVLSGLVVAPYGHIPPRPASLTGVPARIEVVQAAHPVPDAASQKAAERVLALARTVGANDVVLFLVSGGGSSLLALPAPGISLQDKQAIHHALVRSGAAIAEINCVRKHLSAIKGGRLAQACGAARLITLAISDVPGDDPAVIASGPTVHDTTTAQQALAICRRYNIALPQAAEQILSQPFLQPVTQPEATPTPTQMVSAASSVHVVAAPWQSLHAAAQAARAVGLPAYILSDALEGDAVQAAQMHAVIAQSISQHGQPFAKPCLILSGGETTVAVPNHLHPATHSGQGGRATTFALALAQALNGAPHIWALSADTDGIDGTGPHAGAIVTPTTLQQGQAAGFSAAESLATHASANFFAASGGLITTGPTFTNVNDFRALLVL